MNENVIIQSNLDKFIKIRKETGSQNFVGQLIGINNWKSISAIETKLSKISDITYTLLLLITDNHPNYELEIKDNVLDNSKFDILIKPPKNDEIKNFRLSLIDKNSRKVTQKRMSELLSMGGKQVIYNYEVGKRVPSVQTWTVWMLIADKHPKFTLKKR